MASAAISPFATPTMKGAVPRVPMSMRPAIIASRVDLPESNLWTVTLAPAFSNIFSVSATIPTAPQTLVCMPSASGAFAPWA